MNNIELQLSIDGISIEPDKVSNRLLRSVIISLFTWRRAEVDDILPANQKFGWWGDIYPAVANDRIGSRLWLLSRAKFLPDVPGRAKEYAEQALAWLVEDGIASTVEVQAERQGLERLALACLIVRGDGAKMNVRFADIWGYLSNV